jgi:hypothetical protein
MKKLTVLLVLVLLSHVFVVTQAGAHELIVKPIHMHLSAKSSCSA